MGPPYPLSPFQRRMVLSVCPLGAQILDAHFVRDRLLPCPVWIRIALRGGAEYPLILRLDRDKHGVDREARLLPILGRLGLPVAEVLAGPAHDPVVPELGAMAVYTVLPGQDVLGLINHTPRNERDRAGDLLLEAITRLQALTLPLKAALNDAGLGTLLPHKGLAYELQAAVSMDAGNGGGGWRGQPAFDRALQIVGPLVEQMERAGLVDGADGQVMPRAFSNGDFNPANFLSDGRHLTGFVDFSHASWHDPHYGLARYTVYDWIHLDRQLLFRHYRERHYLSERDFALRSAVHCLWSLQFDTPPGDVGSAQRQRILAQLDADVALLMT